MKKLSKKQAVILLENKGTRTFKELSVISGYHEKSLSRILKEIKEGKYQEKHGNYGKEPYNKISKKEKEYLLFLYYSKDYLNKKEFYRFLCSEGYHYSYSFIAKLIITKKKPSPIKKITNILKIPRKMISDNVIQYRNKRYLIKTPIPIFHHECVTLFVKKKTLDPLYIEYKKKRYRLIYQREVYSKRGNTKY